MCTRSLFLSEEEKNLWPGFIWLSKLSYDSLCIKVEQNQLNHAHIIRGTLPTRKLYSSEIQIFEIPTIIVKASHMLGSTPFQLRKICL